MSKKIASLLAAAGILLTGSNCCTIYNSRYNSRQVSETVSIDQLVKNTYCLDSDYVYENEDGDTIEPGSYGSGFAFREVDGFYYLITNQHVLGKPEMEIAGKTFKRKSHRTKIVDSQFDTDVSDDIHLETVFESESLDIAILRTKEPLNLLPESYFGDSSTLNYGEEVYLIGYPLGLFPTITHGIIANPGDYPHVIEVEDPNLNLTVSSISKKVLDISVGPGNSGGPFFVKRGDKFYWMGIVNAYITNRRQHNIGLALAMESNTICEIADYAIANADELVGEKEKLICGEK